MPHELIELMSNVHLGLQIPFDFFKCTFTLKSGLHGFSFSTEIPRTVVVAASVEDD